VQPLKREVEEIMYLHTSIHHKRKYWWLLQVSPHAMRDNVLLSQERMLGSHAGWDEIPIWERRLWIGVFDEGQEITQEQMGVQSGEHNSHPRYKARLVVKVFFIKRRVLSLMRCSLELSRGFWFELPYHGLENWLAWHEYNILACMMSYRRIYTWISQKNSWLQARSTKYAYWRIACIWLESSSLEMV
jgi:hypothetical protein